MKRPGYREAIAWMAEMDDTEWLHDDEPMISVTGAMVADLFDVDHGRLAADLRRAVARVRSRT